MDITQATQAVNELLISRCVVDPSARAGLRQLVRERALFAAPKTSHVEERESLNLRCCGLCTSAGDPNFPTLSWEEYNEILRPSSTE
eukprot:CAMPEP_0170167186 /NCGR_PEP_ID=MMETSP0040_2-20121228/669_1 /TAXON_ID=641309 /ORGANISM="Lotharella oceanica, Strain CCMP622" /LENGTH=86 /DNA_ID=CAMNT_0010405139 /DNA_START=169 /DNA_END=429 /DNA_ORIENTATION=+